MNDLEILNENENQRLSELFGSYIAQKTCVALSSMLGEEFQEQTEILQDGVSKLQAIKLKPDEIILCAVHLSGVGDTDIKILYTIKDKYAKKIAAKLLCQDTVSEIDEMGQSAISEVGNIMTGSFFNAFYFIFWDCSNCCNT